MIFVLRRVLRRPCQRWSYPFDPISIRVSRPAEQVFIRTCIPTALTRCYRQNLIQFLTQNLSDLSIIQLLSNSVLPLFIMRFISFLLVAFSAIVIAAPVVDKRGEVCTTDTAFSEPCTGFVSGGSYAWSYNKIFGCMG
jgi:hypothetical protein